MEQIIEYIKQRYNPSSIILYGSYANGTNNLNSDFDSLVITDSDGRGKVLQAKVLSYLQNLPQKSKAEIDSSIDWCIKMLARVKRCDAEGMFRWHWVLIDSLEIYCDVMHHPYWGPKKSLKWMEENHPTAFDCYQRALRDFSMETLENWIRYIENAKETV